MSIARYTNKYRAFYRRPQHGGFNKHKASIHHHISWPVEWYFQP